MQSFIAVRHAYVCSAMVEVTIVGQDEAPKYSLASDVRISYKISGLLFLNFIFLASGKGALKHTKGGERHRDGLIVCCRGKTQSAVWGLARGLLQPTQVLTFRDGQQQMFRE